MWGGSRKKYKGVSGGTSEATVMVDVKWLPYMYGGAAAALALCVFVWVKLPKSFAKRGPKHHVHVQSFDPCSLQNSSL